MWLWSILEDPVEAADGDIIWELCDAHEPVTEVVSQRDMSKSLQIDSFTGRWTVMTLADIIRKDFMVYPLSLLDTLRQALNADWASCRHIFVEKMNWAMSRLVPVEPAYSDVGLIVSISFLL